MLNQLKEIKMLLKYFPCHGSIQYFLLFGRYGAPAACNALTIFVFSGHRYCSKPWKLDLDPRP